MTKETLKATATKAAENVAETAKSAGREAVYTAKVAASEVASDVAKKAKHEARQHAETGQDMLADQGQRLATGLRDAAADHGAGTLQNRLLDTVASSVSDLSEGLRNRNVDSVLSDVETFARRNPGAFVAGAALAGFALVRFGRASSPSEPDHNSAFGDYSEGTGRQVAGRATSGLPTQTSTRTSRTQS